MGVRTNLLAIYNPDSSPVTDTLTTEDISGATPTFPTGAGGVDDVRGNLEIVEVALAGIIQTLNRLETLFTAAGDSTSATAMSTAITALS